MLSKNKRIQQIASARQLLQVNSVNIGMPNYITSILIALLTCGYIILMRPFFKNAETLWPWYIFISTAYFVILVAILMLAKSKGNPLIITENGIIVKPYVAELWEDLSEYSWENFSGVHSMPFPTKGKISLYLINKKLPQRNIERWTGHTMLAQMGIFFSEEEIKKAETIFANHGIKKI